MQVAKLVLQLDVDALTTFRLNVQLYRSRGVVSPIFSVGCFSALCLHVSHARPGLNCIVLSSQLCCLRVVCINMNKFFSRRGGVLVVFLVREATRGEKATVWR
jgi:hypothetical protein